MMRRFKDLVWRTRSTAIRSARGIGALARIIRSVGALRRRGEPVVWWILSPPPQMVNVGDHAQAVAIERWLSSRLNVNAIEVDKDEYRAIAAVLPSLVRDDDLLLLHSGGNLGDRGIWSESLRRRIVRDFPDNTIISMPQTIYFSPSEEGQRESIVSSETYAAHSSLHIVARDHISLRLGGELFGPACGSLAPDPVLSIPRLSPPVQQRDGVLMCIRSDNESALSNETIAGLFEAVADLNPIRFDTDLSIGLNRRTRARALEEALQLFSSKKLVVTDRFHGMIFAYLAQTPCLVLEAADHKVRGGVHWLRDCPSVQLVTPSELPEMIAQVLATEAKPACEETESRLEDAFAELAELIEQHAQPS